MKHHHALPLHVMDGTRLLANFTYRGTFLRVRWLAHLQENNKDEKINNSWLNTQCTNELPLSSIKKERWKDKESTSTYFLICYDGGYHANTNKPGYPLPPMTTTTTTTTKSHQTITTDISNSINKNEIKLKEKINPTKAVMTPCANENPNETQSAGRFHYMHYIYSYWFEVRVRLGFPWIWFTWK